MSMLRRFQARPWPAAAVVAAIVAALLLFVPVSYQRTVGQEATLTLAVPGLDPTQVQKIASEFKTALHATALSVAMDAGKGCVLTAKVSGKATAPVAQAARAFAEGLSGCGIASTARVIPRVERVLGSGYAYAWDNIINIRVTTTGKTPAQVEAEIRDQLEAAGIQNPSVQYRPEEGSATLTLTMDKPAAECGDGAPCCPEVNVTLDGKDPGEGTAGGNRYRIRITNPDMPQEQMIAEIERQLREQGLDAEVTMQDGRYEVHPRHP